MEGRRAYSTTVQHDCTALYSTTVQPQRSTDSSSTGRLDKLRCLHAPVEHPNDSLQQAPRKLAGSVPPMPSMPLCARVCPCVPVRARSTTHRSVGAFRFQNPKVVGVVLVNHPLAEFEQRGLYFRGDFRQRPLGICHSLTDAKQRTQVSGGGLSRPMTKQLLNKDAPHTSRWSSAASCGP